MFGGGAFGSLEYAGAPVVVSAPVIPVNPYCPTPTPYARLRDECDNTCEI